VSSFPTDYVSVVWPRVRTSWFGERGLLHVGEQISGGDDADPSLTLGFRFAAVQVGYWLGWASIVAVLTGLALDDATSHRRLLVGATLVAAAGNAVAMAIPWRAWLTMRRGRLALDLWSGGLIAFVALLVVSAGSSFALLLFFVVPFIAVVQTGWRRGLWLALSAGACATAAALVPLSASATAMRLALVAAAAAVAVLLARTIRREAAAHQQAVERAELERALARESNHRIKNDLQTVADLLLLSRPAGDEGTPFDETAGRIRSIATVHRLLTETEDCVDAGALLRSITAGAPVPVTVEAEPMLLDAAAAQKLGIIANELLTNAYRHGAPPITISLGGGEHARLNVDDGGAGPESATGFGLSLVRRLTEQGLGGRFDLSAQANGGTRAEVTFPVAR
jgi:two-component sensor histidine kinase